MTAASFAAENNSMTEDFLNDEMLDRLVDGEMSAEERRALIASLDVRPDGWRRCALAFLEAQSWRGDMRRLVIDATRSASDGATPAVTKDPARERPASWSRLNTALAIAASVMLAFGLGSQLRMPRGVTGIDNPSVAVAPPAAPEARQPGGDVDAVTLVLNDTRGAEHRVELPLVEGRRLGENFAEAPQWSESPELQRSLGERGFDLRARRRYAPIYFEQQNKLVPMVVPVDDAVVTPVKRKVL
jgi:hypothetical protein